jgi:hypothetical protein
MISASVEPPLPSLKAETPTSATDIAPSQHSDCTASGSAGARSPHVGRQLSDGGTAPGALSDRPLIDTRVVNRAHRPVRGERKLEACPCATAACTAWRHVVSIRLIVSKPKNDAMSQGIN